ncbi:hypothetical protein Hamer_G026319 [Homarus americanus]|uniref:Uncharacterized protein n=1 Tax=Homarus americanus TaxID=6706 RepID=A0A8J5MJX8_HOMAM|nr:hypothetical protein Hamer_G026319 [Homarus americanus]
MTATHRYTPPDLSWLPPLATPPAGSVMTATHCYTPAGSVMTATTATPQAGSVMTATHPRYTPSWICHDCHHSLHPQLDLSRAPLTATHPAGSVMTHSLVTPLLDLSWLPLTRYTLAGSVMTHSLLLHP